MQILTGIHGKAIRRTAVSGVIWRGRELLIAYSTNAGYYKFPSGGVNASETHKHALARELLEECDVTLLSVDGEIGAIVEYSIPMEKALDVFKMTSYYYLCRIKDGKFAAQKLDGYEAELGFQPMWIDIYEAIEANKSLLYSSIDWLHRKFFALEYLKHNILT